MKRWDVCASDINQICIKIDLQVFICSWYNKARHFEIHKQKGYISCQFPPLGGSINLRYCLQLLISEKLKIANRIATTEARQKMSTDFEFLQFLKFCYAKFKKHNKKVATDLKS